MDHRIIADVYSQYIMIPHSCVDQRIVLGACIQYKIVTGVDTDSIPDSYSRPLANQGTVTAALRLIRGEDL